MKLRDLLAGAAPLDVHGDATIEITAVTHDSRRVVPGTLFCCIPGSRSDGHEFAPAAVKAGASALLLERWVEVTGGAEVAQVRVESVRSAMGPLAARLHGDPSRAMTVLGVTGTNGKTTTTYLLEAIGAAAGLVPGVVGTIETRIAGAPVPAALTTPEAPDLQALLAEMRDADVGWVSMEVSSHALDYGRVDGTWFAAVAFLNLSHDHLDFHGSLDAYFEAKARLFDSERAAAAAINVGDGFGARLADRCRGAGLGLVTFAAPDARADVTAADVTAADPTFEPSGTAFTLLAPRWGLEQRLRTRLIGSFNVANALAAAATALAAAADPEAVVAGLESEVRVPGRFESVDRGQNFAVIVDYAHTPDALTHALRAAREVAGGGRVAVVFGCGGDRDREKRPLMGAAAAAGADRLYVTSDNPRREDPQAIIDAVVAGIPDAADAVVEPDRADAIAQAIADARGGDVVVIAGKGHETGQIVGEETRPFDDRVVAAQALERAGCA